MNMGESTSDPRILMGDSASHLLLLDHFLSVCGICRREACMDII